mmetsp:Transcript_3609/g.3718  ORF Transcript_3609/g.3718 Transcript_3609/m.3718 type:complete len:118 (+) Transcript_3609:335-688(+)
MKSSNYVPSQDHIFHCSICFESISYLLFGRQLKKCPSIIFLEDVYLIKDPFIETGLIMPIAVGGKCAICQNDVCMDNSCSIFYKEQYCANCLHTHAADLPSEVINIFNKRSNTNQTA